MSVRKSDGDFFKSNWDKLAALGGIAVLALVAVFKFVLSSDSVSEGSSSSSARAAKSGGEDKEGVVNAISELCAKGLYNKFN